ncbi:MAG TPA: putative toxin-antitoxin system toxin component, PIN family [Desulfatiglandales bacterium]|nr:putative toxin-antitoxin system toxin component, PIN family [Desulfatiglandales bacterium]
MIKVVIDTNIYISAVLFGGNSEKIRKLAREGKIELLISENILAEIAGVLKRKFNWFDWQVSELIKDIRDITTLVTPVLSLSIIKEDEPDNRFLECAIEGKAQYIISGDKRHLQPLKEYQGIKILSPAQFLELTKLGFQ